MWRDDLSRFSLGVGKGRMVRIWYNLCMIAANSLGKPGPASWDLVGHGQIFHIKTSINCLLGQLVRSSLPILLIYYPWEDVFCLVVEFSEVTLMNSLAENIQTKTQLSSIREQARNARWRSWRQRSCQAVSNSTMGPIVCLMMNLH